jgi:small ligand-binding sensory domain FIST
VTTTRVGDGLAVDTDLLVAAERAVAAALAALGGATPDLACVFVSGGTPEETERAVVRAAELSGARTSLGCGAHGVMAAGHGVEAEHGVSVWVASLPSVSVRAFHLEVLRMTESVAVLGMPVRRDDDVVGVVIADPFSFPADGFVARSHDSLQGLPLVGGMASGALVAGGTRLLVDGRVVDRGAVGVVLGGDLSVHTMVSQGCRPIGLPMTVTCADGATLYELAGRPAFEQAKNALASLDEDEQVNAVRGLQLGLVADEYVERHEQGDFLVRAITGADHASGAITTGEVIPVGTTVQFLLRDTNAAHEDLSAVLGAVRRSIGLDGIAGALVFSAGSRGRSMFPTTDHDVAAVRGALGTENVAGFFTSGEIGPLAGRNHVHGFSATVLAFDA